ncbi:MAG TPA: DegT/DnrJ/EryC1/StrS family aminotransferase [Acidimicrobiales bacterium]|nr:DegT/DnrJ/EryC1/StrS family aminotransferase [Acidimicrobiales bacterium]
MTSAPEACDHLDVPYTAPASLVAPMRQELMVAVSRVIDRGDFVLGEEVSALEQRLAGLVGARFAVAVRSGTDALELSLRALGLRDGDEVITAPNCFVGVAGAIVRAGGVPVFVDVGRDYNIDPGQVEASVTARTRVVLPLHTTGRPADMDAITAIAARFGLLVVEDVAQAALARYRDRAVGGLGDVGCFTFGPSVPLGACGDGGMVVTNDEPLARRVIALRDDSRSTTNEPSFWSGNSRLDTVQAAIILAMLEHAQQWAERRRHNADLYREALGGLPGTEVPHDREWEYSVYDSFVVQVDQRDALRAHLYERGIETFARGAVPLHLQPVALALGYRVGDFPNAESQAKKGLGLPVHPGLSEDQLQHVVDSIGAFASPRDG